MTRLRIGVVGAGLIGQVEHIPNLERLSAFYEIVGIADASARIRMELERRGFRVCPDYRQLLDNELDALLVAAPDQYHAEITLAALDRGLNVFCEKPLCFSVAEAREIAATRDRVGQVVQVGWRLSLVGVAETAGPVSGWAPTGREPPGCTAATICTGQGADL